MELLTGSRQSGGEKAVSTVLYLMALQAIAKVGAMPCRGCLEQLRSISQDGVLVHCLGELQC